jgi:hypothetical protein
MTETYNSLASEFLAIFNKIEHELQELYGSTKYVGFKRMVEALSKEHGLIAEYAIDLIEYLQLRNAIVHKTTGEPIAEPHPEVITAIRELHTRLINPPTAFELAAKPVYSCQTSDYLMDVISQMKQHFYSMVPVYHDRHFVGALSDHSLVLWMGSLQKGENVDLNTQTVGGLQEFFGHQDDKYSGYRFIKPETDVFTVRDFFLSFISEKKRLGAVFITKSGDEQSEITGVITAWDMSKISKEVAPTFHYSDIKQGNEHAR